MQRVVATFAAALLVFVSTRCAPDAARHETLLVAAAADLAGAMPAIVQAFERETGIRITATLGSSGQLAQQILHGAPIDVFLSADHGWAERLDRAGKLVPGTMTTYAYGRLAVISRKHAQARRIEQLGDANAGRIAIANPEHAPYGRAAREALAAAGLLDALGSRLITAENVRQTIQMVESRGVDAAVTALSLVRDEAHAWTLVPQELHAPLVQTAAIVVDRPRRAEAERFLRFLLGARGREILSRYSFILPELT